VPGVHRTALLLVSLVFAFGSATAQTVVDYTKLLPLLPPPPEGWKAEKPDGSTSGEGAEKISAAGRSYTRGEADDAPTASLNIFDAAVNKGYRDTVTAEWKREEKTDAGYGKPISYEGWPGFEHYEADTKTAMIWVRVADRFFVQVELVNLDPAELQTWLKRIDLKALAALK
jgi:hypothetical protein